eukprot:1160350-Pelagomonas_calceolata.AAC.3
MRPSGSETLLTRPSFDKSRDGWDSLMKVNRGLILQHVCVRCFSKVDGALKLGETEEYNLSTSSEAATPRAFTHLLTHAKVLADLQDLVSHSLHLLILYPFAQIPAKLLQKKLLVASMGEHVLGKNQEQICIQLYQELSQGCPGATH